MTQSARIKLTSTNLPKLDDVCDEIMGIGKKTGVKIKGPTP
ncbi:MAG: 30S ribosomal protein S10, partial [Thaumarchaeota archaeon]|nr:30S ribosomal protein S10 [Nitrososphaerota archaeon]